MTFPKLTLSATLLAFLLMTVGCGAPETESPSGALRQSDEVAEVEDTSKEQTEGSLELPEGFPADFPLPPDYDIYESKFVAGSPTTGANYLVRGRSSANVAELVTFYRERLPQAGFKVIQQPPESTPTASPMFYFQNDTYSDCSVQMRQEDGLSDVLINLPLRDG